VSKTSSLEKAVREAIGSFGKIHFLFNNAGCELVKPLLETSEEEYDLILETNLKGTFFLSKLIIQSMIDTASDGVVINTASDAGLRGIRWNAAYSASKAAIIHLTRSIAMDYATKGIRCNCICPGVIRTPLCERFNAEVGLRHGRTGEAVLQEFIDGNVPMKRVGLPEEVASLVLFLCSEEAGYINGAVVPIDGGLTAGM
jgi:meso-butanediol dehydrogenase / (S,S)-butanediol dehydrogenase / diacetyl reductase